MSEKRIIKDAVERMIGWFEMFIILCLLIALHSCSNPEPVNQTAEDKALLQPLDTAPNVGADTALLHTATKNDTTTETILPRLDQAKNSKKTKDFLNNPFDFFAFKKAVRGANTTSSRDTDAYYQPQHEGFFFTYFVFNNCRPYGLQITVYKEGKTMGKFSDKNETLVRIENRCALEALGELNLIGKGLADIEATIGSNYIRNGNQILFAEQGTFLLLELGSNASVKRYDYCSTNKEEITSFSDIQKF